MKKRKRHVVLLAVTGMLMAGAVVLFAERDAIEEQIKGKAAREIGKKIFEEQLEKTVNVGGQNPPPGNRIRGTAPAGACGARAPW